MNMKAALELERDSPGKGVMPKDFREWMTAEQRRIYLLCLRMLRSGDEADSATQDVFVKAYRALKRQKTQGNGNIENPDKWLTRVAINTCVDRLRSRKWLFWRKRVSYEDEQAIFRSTPEKGLNQENVIHAMEINLRLAVALDKLSTRQRSVFVLRHQEGYSLEEIARILELDIGTVKAHMARAIQKLREELRDLYGRRTPGR